MLQLPPGVQVPPMAAGALSGAISGQNQGNLQNTIQRNFRDSDLQNQIQQNAYDQSMLDNPNLAAGRATDMLKQGATQDQYNSGQEQAGMTGVNQSKAARGLKDESEAKLADRANHMQAFSDMNQALDSSGGDAVLMNPQASKAILDIGRKAGLTGMPDSLTPEAIAKIKMMGNVAQNSLASIEAERKARQSYEQQVGAGNAAKGKGSIELQNEGHLASAQAMAQNSLAAKTTLQADPAKTKLEVVQAIEATGQATPELAQKWISSMKEEMLPVFKDVQSKKETELMMMPQDTAKTAGEKIGVPYPGKKGQMAWATEGATAFAADAVADKLAGQFKDRFAGKDFKGADGEVKPLSKVSTNDLFKTTSPKPIAPAAPVKAATDYQADIAKVQGANPKASQADIIKAMKDAGKLPKDYQ